MATCRTRSSTALAGARAGSTAPRLLEAMIRAVRHPVTLVAAPAGTARRPWSPSGCRREDLPPAWVSLDSGDNDPDRLWSHVAGPWNGQGACCPSPSRCGCSTAPAGAAGPAVGDHDRSGGAPDDLVLVLDDFHFVQSAAATRRSSPWCRASRAGAPRDRQPVRPRPAAGPAARLPRPGRAAGRGPAFTSYEARRDARVHGVTLSDDALAAARRTDRGLARSPLPRRFVPDRPTGS